MLVSFAASLTFVPLAAAAATVSDVGGVTVIVDGSPAAPSRAGKPAHHAIARALRGASEVPETEQASAGGSSIVQYAMRFVGVPYVWGGAAPSGFDCSGFTQYIFARLGVAIPRTADVQFYAGRPVDDPQPGDLVFFQTYAPGPSHVGIYIGNGYFINSIRPNVHIASFASSYFRDRYLGARRFI
jgi:cell wall-associated NlpC family hydrolase